MKNRKKWFIIIGILCILITFIPLGTAHGDETGEEDPERVAMQRQDLDLMDYPAVCAFLDGLPTELAGFEALPPEWWEALLPNERIQAEVVYRRFLDGYDGGAYEESYKELYPELYIEETVGSENTDEGIMAVSGGDAAVLECRGVTVGYDPNKVNRKWLNGQDAFCYDEFKAFPNGATYPYKSAAEARIRDGSAYIIQFYADSGETNDHWWSTCQVALWAYVQGYRTEAQALAFTNNYLKQRGITDPGALDDYRSVIPALISQANNASGTAYLYTPSDGNHQRIATTPPIWEPTPGPSPQYDTVSVEKDTEVSKTHTVTVDHKYASYTGDPIPGVTFEVYENDILRGTITTDEQGRGSLSWQFAKTGSGSGKATYCTNYDQLDNMGKAEVSCHTSYAAAYQAAEAEALSNAKKAAEAEANAPVTVTVRETEVPEGFALTEDSEQSFTLVGDDSCTVSAANDNRKAPFVIEKIDSITGELIQEETIFTLYEWDGSQYVETPHYQVIRLEDGTYTVKADYEAAEQGYLYYTPVNLGKFGLAEATAPLGYVKDPDIWYFTIPEDGGMIYGRNADLSRYPIQDPTKYANLPRTLYVRIIKEDAEGPEEAQTVLKGGAAYRIRLLSDPAGFSSTEWQVDEEGYLWYSDAEGTQWGSARSPFVTEIVVEDGMITDAWVEPEHPLPFGTYELTEVQSPGGYLLQGENTVIFQITDEISEEDLVDQDGRKILTVRQEDLPQKGIIQVRKLGEKFLGFDEDELVFRYEQAPVEGAVFEVYAEEDIYSQQLDAGCLEQYSEQIREQYLLHRAGDLIGTITTDTKGYGSLAGLDLGRYCIKEVQAGAGFLRNPKEETVVISAAEGTQAMVTGTVEYVNDRQKTELSVIKLDAETEEPLAGAVFGLYNAEPLLRYEDMSAQETSVPGAEVVLSGAERMIPAGTLLETVTTDEEGVAKFLSDLPNGQWIVRELCAPAGYLQSEGEHFFDGRYTGQEGEAVLRLQWECYDQPVIGLFRKMDGNTGSDLAGCTLEVLDGDGTVIDRWISDGSLHCIRNLELHHIYTLREAAAAAGYTVAQEIRFQLVQKTDDTGALLPEVVTFIEVEKNGKVSWAEVEDGRVTMIDHKKKDPPPAPEPPVTGDENPVFRSLFGILVGVLLFLGCYIARRIGQTPKYHGDTLKQ